MTGRFKRLLFESSLHVEPCASIAVTAPYSTDSGQSNNRSKRRHRHRDAPPKTASPLRPSRDQARHGCFRPVASPIHPCASFFPGSFSKMDPFDARIFRAFHLNGGAGFDETRGNFRKVFHERPENGNFSKRCGLQNVVTAGLHQRTADKSAVGQAGRARLVRRCCRAKEPWRHPGYRWSCLAGLGADSRPGNGNSERRTNFRWDSSMNSAAADEALRLARCKH